MTGRSEFAWAQKVATDPVRAALEIHALERLCRALHTALEDAGATREVIRAAYAAAVVDDPIALASTEKLGEYKP